MNSSGNSRCIKAVALAQGMIDGSDEEVRRARQHVVMCPTCADAMELDLSLPALRAPARSSRVAVLIVSIFQATFAVRWLFGATWLSSEVSAAHLTRDGALGLAMAAVGVSAFFRPGSARPLLGIGAVLLAVQALTGVIDKQAGWVHLPFEGVHVFNVLILSLVFAISRHHQSPLIPEPKPASAGLQLVNTQDDEGLHRG